MVYAATLRERSPMKLELNPALLGFFSITCWALPASAQVPSSAAPPPASAAPPPASAAPVAPLPSSPPVLAVPVAQANPCVLSDAAGRCVQWALSAAGAPALETAPPKPVISVDAPPSPTAPDAQPTLAENPEPAAEGDTSDDEAEAPGAAGPSPGMVHGESEFAGDRTLLGHTFLYPRLFENAFVAASFYVGSSVEFYHQPGVTARVPTTTGTTDTITFDRDITFVKLNYGADLRASEYLSFGVDADYLAEVGTNGQTLFTWGGSGGFDVRPNAKLRIFRSDATGSQLALRGFGTFQAGIRAMPLGLLIDISNQIKAATQDPAALADCLIQANFECLPTPDVGTDITASRKRFGGGAALAYAQALGRYAGGQLAVGVESASTDVTLPLGGGATTKLGSSETSFYAGISPSLNFYPLLPVGLTYEYRVELNKSSYDTNATLGLTDATKVSTLSHRMNWGLYYTGRRDLMLGWLAGVSFLQDLVRSMQHAATDPRAFVFAAQFDMRYFF